MKLEDIKKMSNEEFIKLINDLRKNELEKFVMNKKATNRMLEFGYTVATSALGGFCLFTLKEFVDMSAISPEYMLLLLTGTLAVSGSAGYFAGKNEIKRNEKQQKEQMEKSIISLKEMLGNLSEEDVKLLIQNFSTYSKQISNELVSRSDVLLAADKLIKLDASKLLEDLEVSMVDQNSNSYSDDGKTKENIKVLNKSN